MWIHEHQNWPNFTWDTQSLAFKLSQARYRQGRLLGRMQGLGFALRQEAVLNTLTDDVVKTSAIEGEYLNSDEVRSSIARRLGMDVAGLISSHRNVEGIVEIMLDATQNFIQPLTKARLCHWHAALFPTGRSGMYAITVGHWRSMASGPMQVVSGAIGREKVHFEAPSAEKLEDEMAVFSAWLEENQEIDPILKAGIAHFWFVTIHPFEDGNGRIARALTDMVLARSEGMPERFYSFSSQIERERKDYYEQLEAQQRGTPDITHWLLWFVGCFSRVMDNAEKTLDQVLFKAKLWEKMHSQGTINERQRNVINRMFEPDFQGHMNTSKYAKLAKCSTDTALRDIQALKALGVLMQNISAGRSTSYRLVDKKQVFEERESSC